MRYNLLEQLAVIHVTPNGLDCVQVYFHNKQKKTGNLNNVKENVFEMTVFSK